MEISMSQTFAWKPAEGSDLLVRESEALEVDMGMLGKQTGTVIYSYAQAGGFMLPVQVETSVKAPPMMGGDQHQVVVAKNLVVNGEPAPTPAVAPTTAPATDAAPREGEGG
jgi:hypothetical protein